MNILRSARAPYVLALLLPILGLFSTAEPAQAGAPSGGTPRDLHIITACRIYDSRPLPGDLTPGTTYTFDLPPAGPSIPDRCGVPTDAVAVIINATIISDPLNPPPIIPPRIGYVSVFKGGTTPPGAGVVSFEQGDVLGQFLVVQLGEDPNPDLSFRVVTELPAGTFDVAIDVLAFNGSGAPSDILLSDNTVEENQPVGTTVGTLSTLDPDFDDTHTYTLVAGVGSADNSKFQISVDQLLTNAILDLKGQPTYSIRVRSTDTFGVFFEKVFTISADNVNEAPTDITLSPSTVNEGLPVGSLVGTFSTADVDLGDSHTYAFVTDPQGPDNGSFQISGNQLLTNAVFDREVKSSYTIYVSTTDSGTLSFNKQLIVTVDDVNDPPAPSGGPFSLAENSAAGTVVGTVAANDPDAGQTHTFTITAGNTGGAFAIDNSGVITVASQAALNFETTPTFNLTVQATDNGSPVQSGSGTVVVNLTDVNEPPVPSGGPFSLPENSAANTVVGTVSAGEPDGGQTHTFAITAGNTGGAFSIDSGGVIKVATPAALDFETTPTFNLTVQVTDNGSPVLSGSATVVVNLTDANDAPVPNGGPFSVPENSANGTTVGTVTFTDQDTGQSHTFAITAGNTGGAFAIDGSGVITVASSAALNFETNPTFSLTVQVTDNGTPALSGSTTVVVNLTDVNEVPAPSGGPFSVAENSANGTPVGTVAAGDPDSGQSHTFAITAGNTGGAFAINGSGVITVANSAALNFETTPIFSLTVQVTDNGTPVLSGLTTVVVNLTNVNEAPTPSGGPFSLPENSANGTTVGTVTVSDQDTGQSYTFSITAGNTGAAFVIDSSGVITVANSAALNFETTPIFNLTVQVTDNGTPVLSGSTTVVVNLTDVNEAPTPSGGPFSVAENSANGTTVGTVSAGDPDGGQSHTFAITAGNTNGAFAINSSGVITVANTAALDFETTPTFSLTVQVTDNGTPVLSGSTTVIVNLTNVNEAPVPSGGPFTIPENSPNGTSVGTVSVVDPDAGQSHTFAITAGNTGGAFAINSSGLITVANVTAVNFEVNPTFNLTVQATDNGTPVLSGSTTVVVNLLNVPEAPIAGDEGTPGSPYAETVGNTLLEVKAAVSSLTEPKVIFIGNILTNDTDPDGPTTFTITLESATAGAVVTLNPDGTFTYVPPPGFTGNVDNFTYRITDPSGLFDTATVYINVKHRVWYVKNNTGTAGTAGTTADPFNTLAEAEAASGNGDTIYLFGGDGTTGGQSDGITLKASQRLVGEGVQLAVPSTVTINGTAGLTLRTTTGSGPKIENDNTPDAAGEDNGVSVAANAGNLTGVEIRGLDIQGFDNAIDVTATGANNADVTISDNVISGSGIEGIDVNANSTGAVTLSIQGNSITAGVRGIDVLRTAGTCTIRAFANNAITGNTGGSGVEINGAIFDATPGNPIDLVSGGTIGIGQSGNGVSTNGLLLTNVTGEITFTDLDIYNDAGAGLSITSTGALNVAAGTGFRFGVTSGAATIDSNGGPAVSVSNSTFNLPALFFLRSTNSTTTGLSLVNAFGGAGSTTLSAGSGQIADPVGASGTAVNIDGGNGNITLGIPIINNSGRSVSITNRTSDTVSFTNTINDTGNGVFMNSNAGATMSYSGGLTINTGTNPAFTATGGGTVTATNTSSTLASTTGTALNVANTTIGASGLSFRSIAANGAANGIVLNTTGAGGLTVAGSGTTPGSGGTIQNISGRGASFISAANITLKNMNFTNTATSAGAPCGSAALVGGNTGCNAAVHLNTVTNATLDRLNITTSGQQGINGIDVTGFALTNSSLSGLGNAADEDGLHFLNMVGASTISSTTIASSGDDNVNIQNRSATASSITITGGSFNTGVLGSGLLFGIRDTSNTTLSISGVTSDNNFSGGIVADAFDTATLSLNVTGATITNNNDGVQVSSSQTSNVQFDIDDNDFIGNDFLAVTLLKAAFSTGGTLEGAVRNNNPITVANGRTTDAISVFQAGGGALKVALTNNVINYAGTQRAILLQAGQDGNGTLDATITGNSLDIQLDGTGNAIAGILAQTAITGPGNTAAMCADLGGAGALRNTFTHSLGGSMAGGDIRARQRNDGTFRLPGYAGGATDTAAVITYLSGRNTVLSTPTATADSTGFGGGAACAQPIIP